MSNATLIAHVGGKYRTREELDGLETPEGTRTWRPVPHHELVRELTGGLEAAGIGIVKERYATMGRTDAKLFGALDLACPTFDTADYRLALGLRAANDQSMKIQVVTGARVFVCDNMAFSGTGGAVMLARKHTSGLDLSREVPRAVDAAGPAVPRGRPALLRRRGEAGEVPRPDPLVALEQLHRGREVPPAGPATPAGPRGRQVFRPGPAAVRPGRGRHRGRSQLIAHIPPQEPPGPARRRAGRGPPRGQGR
jgi:hypothetical protein